MPIKKNPKIVWGHAKVELDIRSDCTCYTIRPNIGGSYYPVCFRIYVSHHDYQGTKNHMRTETHVTKIGSISDLNPKTSLCIRDMTAIAADIVNNLDKYRNSVKDYEHVKKLT